MNNNLRTKRNRISYTKCKATINLFQLGLNRLCLQNHKKVVLFKLKKLLKICEKLKKVATRTLKVATLIYQYAI